MSKKEPRYTLISFSDDMGVEIVGMGLTYAQAHKNMKACAMSSRGDLNRFFLCEEKESYTVERELKIDVNREEE